MAAASANDTKHAHELRVALTEPLGGASASTTMAVVTPGGKATAATSTTTTAYDEKPNAVWIVYYREGDTDILKPRACSTLRKALQVGIWFAVIPTIQAALWDVRAKDGVEAVGKMWIEMMQRRALDVSCYDGDHKAAEPFYEKFLKFSIQTKEDRQTIYNSAYQTIVDITSSWKDVQLEVVAKFILSTIGCDELNRATGTKGTKVDIGIARSRLY